MIEKEEETFILELSVTRHVPPTAQSPLPLAGKADEQMTQQRVGFLLSVVKNMFE